MVRLNNDFQRLKPSLKMSNSDSGRRTEFLIGGYHTILRQVSDKDFQNFLKYHLPSKVLKKF